MNIFSTISFVQGLLTPAMTLVVGLEAYLIPDSEIRTLIMAFTTAVFMQLISSFRKPSTAGGTVAPAATIDKNLTIDPSTAPVEPGAKPANVRVTVNGTNVQKP